MIYQPTFALNKEGDSYLDSNGNIAIITGIDSVSQTVSNALQLWLGEYQFDTTLGVPWYNILGDKFNRLLVNNYITDEILALPYIKEIISINYVFNNINRSTTINLIFLTVDSSNPQESTIVI
jgi:hypothetical protein